MRSLRLQELQCISSLIDRFPLLLIRSSLDRAHFRAVNHF